MSGRYLALKSSVKTSKPGSLNASAVEPVPENRSKRHSLEMGLGERWMSGSTIAVPPEVGSDAELYWSL